nr:hypothetical protein [Brenneria salicis]
MTVTTGRNRVSADLRQVERRTDNASSASVTPPEQPKLAVDVAQLGGMYAGKIQLIGTEKGVGVRNAGTIGAQAGRRAGGQAGSVTITADGRIENSGSINASQNVQLTGSNLDNHGKVYAQQDVTVNARQQAANRGVLAAQRHTALTADKISNQQGAVLGAGINSDGSVADSGDLSLAAAQRIEANGQHLAGGSLRMAAAEVNADGSQTQATNVTLNASAGSVSSRQAQISADSQLSVAAAKAVNNAGGTLIAGKSLAVRAESLSGDGQLLSLGDMSLTAARRFDNHSDVIANGKLDLTVAGEVTNHRKIQSGNALTLTADRLDNQSGGEISSLKTQLTLTDTLTNCGLIDGGQTRIDAVTLNNIGSGRVYGDWISLQSQTLNNLDENGIGGSIAARQGLNLGIGTLNNRQQALIYSDGAMALGGSLERRDWRRGRLIRSTTTAPRLNRRGTWRCPPVRSITSTTIWSRKRSRPPAISTKRC